MKPIFLTAFALLIAFSTVAKAGDGLEEARVLYHDGAFTRAAESAALIGSAEALALAARAALTHAAYIAEPEDALQALSHAEELARSALEQDSENVEAMLHLAITLGYRARTQGYIKAHFAGRAREARALIDKALALEPDLGWAHAAKGAWHAELVVAGGGLLAKAFYGASAKKAFDHYRSAVAALPSNPVIRVEFAKALLRLRTGKYRTLAKQELETAMAFEPADRFEAIVRDRGRDLLAAFAMPRTRDLRAAVEGLEPFSRRAATGSPR